VKKRLGEVVGKESEDFTRHDKWLCMMNTWAQNAGKQFKYYLVYDKLKVEGSKTKEQFLELMKDL
jgi:hypothetical protein